MGQKGKGECMKPIGDVIGALAKRMEQDKALKVESDCEHCGKLIEVKEFEVNGHIFKHKGVCQCVQDKLMEKTRMIEEQTIKSENRSLYNIGNAGDKYKDLGFDSYRVNEGNEMIFKWAKGYAKTFASLQKQEDKKGKGFNFWGEPGNGKTMLVSMIANELRKQGYNVVFTTLKSLLSDIKSTYNKDNSGTESKIMKGLLTCDLLIIDDLGAERLTDWAQETLFEIVDARYDKKRPIITTSNVEPSMWKERLGERIHDRFEEIIYHGENKNKSQRSLKAEKEKADFFKDLFDEDED